MGQRKLKKLLFFGVQRLLFWCTTPIITTPILVLLVPLHTDLPVLSCCNLPVAVSPFPAVAVAAPGAAACSLQHKSINMLQPGAATTVPRSPLLVLLPLPVLQLLPLPAPRCCCCCCGDLPVVAPRHPLLFFPGRGAQKPLPTLSSRDSSLHAATGGAVAAAVAGIKKG